jgi:hypothetical protein
MLGRPGPSEYREGDGLAGAQLDPPHAQGGAGRCRRILPNPKCPVIGPSNVLYANSSVTWTRRLDLALHVLETDRRAVACL